MSKQMKKITALDMDQTTIFSTKHLQLPMADSDVPELRVAEVYRGAPLSFITQNAWQGLKTLQEHSQIIAVTTRTQEQYSRIRLPFMKTAPHFAITANGANILVDGHEDRQWAKHMQQLVNSTCAPKEEIFEHMMSFHQYDWCEKYRTADDLFAYLVIDKQNIPSTFLPELSTWLEERDWKMSFQGRKVYALPKMMTKAYAIEQLADRYDTQLLNAAGDSLLDQEMLEVAKFAYRPRHGELDRLHWKNANLKVTTSKGIFAGEEIITECLIKARNAA